MRDVRRDRYRGLTGGLIVVLLAAGGCAAGGDAPGRGEASARPSVQGATGHEAQWSYSGERGPEQWGELPGAAACATGRRQSPIDLADAAPRDLRDVRFAYSSSAVELDHTGHAVVARFAGGGHITTDGGRYDLVQVHYHTPGEHTLDGRFLPAELHFVHENRVGALAVVGVLVEEGAAHPGIAALVAALPDHEGVTTQVEGTLDPGDLLPRRQHSYRYTGSLTTPPCSEGVAWFVVADPIPASRAQLDALAAAVESNNRPVQRRNDRALALDTTP